MRQTVTIQRALRQRSHSSSHHLVYRSHLLGYNECLLEQLPPSLLGCRAQQLRDAVDSHTGHGFALSVVLSETVSSTDIGRASSMPSALMYGIAFSSAELARQTDGADLTQISLLSKPCAVDNELSRHRKQLRDHRPLRFEADHA